MGITESVSGTLGPMTDKIMGSIVSGTVIVVGVVLLAAGIGVLGFYMRYRSQFIYKVEIQSKRSSGLGTNTTIKIIEDKGAFIRNKKDKTTWFRLLNQKVDLLPPPLEAINLGIGGKNYVKIYQASDEEYYYILPDEIIFEKDSGIASKKVKVISGDAAYWNSLRKRDNRKLFDMESTLMKLLPYIIPVLMFVLVIFLSYMLIGKWDTVGGISSQQLEIAKMQEKSTEELGKIASILSGVSK